MALRAAKTWWNVKMSLSSFPKSVRKLLLYGIPSLALLGLAGVTGWLWLKRKKRVAVVSDTGSLTVPAQQSTCSEDSGVVTNPQRRESLKCTEENLSSPVNAHHQGPAEATLHSDSPLKLSKSWTYPTASSDIQSETLSELASVSSDGLLSSCDNPPTSQALSEHSSKPPNYLVASSSLSKLDSPTVEGNNIQSSRSTPSFARPDRVRVMVQLPKDLVGRFIGKQGRNIKGLMADSNGAHVYVNQKNLPKDALMVPCTVQGNSEQVEMALKIIEAKYPEVDVPAKLDREGFSQAPFPSPLFGTPRQNGESWNAELNPATIPDSPFNATVSYIENIDHVWLVTCERSAELDEQHQSMSYTYCYAEATVSASVTAKEGDHEMLGKYCAVRVSDIHWLRGQVIQFSDGGANYEVQLMDYGSTVIVPPSSMRPLRREHTQLCIQAFPCQLANIVPCEEGTEEAENGLVALQALVEGLTLEVHITGHVSSSGIAEDDPAAACCELQTPLVELYAQFGSQTPVFVNRELVEQGFATWREDS